MNRLLASESSAPARPPGAPEDEGYQSFYAALSAGPRGRDFLAEFARRNRNADTEMLLAAFDRLQALMRAEGTALERLRDELRLLLIAIRLGRPDIDAADPPIKAAKLAALLDLLEHRIDSMVDVKSAAAAPVTETGTDEPAAEITRPLLSVVPPADEPELPIPSPAGTQPTPIALVGTVAAMPEVTCVEIAPPEPVTIEKPADTPVVTVTLRAAEAVVSHERAPETNEPTPKPAVAARPVDPLAAIMAMSEAERIALFT